jgi:hypothetical protein
MSNIIIKWGDGGNTGVTLNNNDYYTVTKIYSVNKDYIINISGDVDTIDELILSGSSITIAPDLSDSRLNIDLLDLSSNLLTNMPNINNKITYLDFSDNQISAVTFDINQISFCDLANNNLSTTEVNAILAKFVNTTVPSGTLLLNGTNMGAPSGQGLTDKATLISNGWTVTTN